MNALDLIGTAGAAALLERLQGLGADSGTARFMLDRLTGPQVAAIVRQLVSDASVQSQVKIAVPPCPRRWPGFAGFRDHR